MKKNSVTVHTLDIDFQSDKLNQPVWKGIPHGRRETQSTHVMYGYTYSKSMNQPDKVANPAMINDRGQLNRENEKFPVRVRA